jgi:hypothetical protein
MRLLDLLDGNLSRDALTSSEGKVIVSHDTFSTGRRNDAQRSQVLLCQRPREISGSFSPHLPTRRYCIAAPNLL